MDRRLLAQQFRERVGLLIGAQPGGLTRFARTTGVDRSALSQLLDPRNDRLPRAETLHTIATRCGVTTDWLLSLSNAQSGGHQVAPMLEFEEAFDRRGTAPSERWREEARGYKLRYIPSSVPHLMRLPEIDATEAAEAGGAESGMSRPHPDAAARLRDPEAWLTDMDVEICMPVQTLDDLARGASVWVDLPASLRRAQIERIGELTERHYPALRLHLFDMRRVNSAPYTVFGPIRAVIYLGQSYLVITAADQVQAIARHFDGMVRDCVSDPGATARMISDAAAAAR